MAHSGKTITFATDLLPQEDNTYSLGAEGQKWKIPGATITDRITTTKPINQIVTGTGTAGSYTNSTYYPAKWKFNLGTTAPVNGDIITIKIPVAGHDYGVFLSVNNEVNYHPVVLTGSNRLTSQFPANTYITVIFESTASASNMYALNGQTSSTRVTITGGAWRVINYYDSNSDNGYYQRMIYPNIKAGTGSIHPYSIVMQLANGRFSSVTTTAPNNPGTSSVSAKATGKSVNTNEFRLSPIYYMRANTTYADGSNVGTYNMEAFSSGLIDGRYSFNLENTAGKRFTGYAPVYLIGTLSNGMIKLDSGENVNWWTTTLPNTDDGKIYIYLGDAYDWYRFTLQETHPIYWYKDGAIRLYSGASEYALKAPLSGITGADDLKAIEAINETSGLLKKTAANTWSLDTNAYVTSSGVTSITIKTTSPLTGGSNTATTATGTYTLGIDTSGTWSGKAGSLTDLGTSDGASSTNTARYVWFAYNDNKTGRPAYSSALTFQTSTGNLSSTKFNNLTLTAATTGFTIAGGSTTSKTLTVSESITLQAGAASKLAWYSSANTISGARNAYLIDESGTSVANKRNELVLGNATGKASNGSAFGRLALYSAGTTGTYLISAESSNGWFTATLQAKTGTIAYTSDIPTNLNQLTNGPGYVTSSGVTNVAWDATNSKFTQTIDGTTSDIVSLATMGLSSAMHYRGTITTDPTVTAPEDTYASGDVLVDTTTSKEYVYDGTNWRELGDESSFSLNNHVHGNITNDGKIGSTANKVAITTTGGLLTVASTMYANNTKLAINSTSEPTQNFYVKGDAEITGPLRITATSGGKRILIGNQDSSGVNCPVILNAANGTLSIGNGSSWESTGGTLSLAIYMSKDRKIGIGTNSPATLLQVAGTSTLQHIYTSADATYDIGESATRWRTAYLTTSVLVGAKSTITAYNSNALGSFIGPGVFSSCVTEKGNGYYMFGKGVQYGRLYIEDIGVAGTASTTYTNPNDGSQTRQGYSGAVTGKAYLILGNNKAAGSNGSSYSSPGSAGTVDNAQGILRLFSNNTGSADLTAYTGGDKTRIYPSEGYAVPENKVGIMFRPGSSSYYTHFSYQTSGNEALVMATQNSNTSFIFINGESYANISGSRWYNLTPALQIKNNSVYIGELIATGTTPSYKFKVKGTSYFTDTMTISNTLTLYREGTTSANNATQLTFTNKDTTTTQTTSAFIKVYNDHAATSYGGNMLIQSGGVLILGGGEAPQTLYDAIKSNIGTTEHTYLVSDGSTYIYSNPTTIANRTGVLIDTTGHLVPQKAEGTNDNKQNLGASGNRWATIYGVTLDSSILKLHQGSAADPSTSSNARIEFNYSNGQAVHIAYTPNDSYRQPAGLKIIGNGLSSGEFSSPAWFEVEGSIYADGGSEKGYRVPTTGNDTGSVGGTTTPVYVDGGEIKSCTSYADASVDKATKDSDGNAINTTYLKLSGGTITGTLTLSKTQDASGTANNSPALIVGGAATSTHLELDCNEIMAKTNGTTTADLYLNTDGNAIFLGKAANGTNDYVSVRSTRNATSTSNGALRVGGGISVANDIYMGGQLTIANSNAGAICMTRTSGPNWIWANNASTSIAFCVDASLGALAASLKIEKTAVTGYNNNYADLGTATVQWKSVHAYKYLVEEHVTMQWNSTDQSLDFIFA